MTKPEQTQTHPPDKMQDITQGNAQPATDAGANNAQGLQIRRSVWVELADGTRVHFYSRPPCTAQQLADHEFYEGRRRRWQARTDRVFRFIRHPLRGIVGFMTRKG